MSKFPATLGPAETLKALVPQDTSYMDQFSGRTLRRRGLPYTATFMENMRKELCMSWVPACQHASMLLNGPRTPCECHFSHFPVSVLRKGTCMLCTWARALQVQKPSFAVQFATQTPRKGRCISYAAPKLWVTASQVSINLAYAATTKSGVSGWAVRENWHTWCSFPCYQWEGGDMGRNQGAILLLNC